MRLEVVGSFPKGTLAVLEISLEWGQLLQVQPVQVKGAKQRRLVYSRLLALFDDRAHGTRAVSRARERVDPGGSGPLRSLTVQRRCKAANH